MRVRRSLLFGVVAVVAMVATACPPTVEPSGPDVTAPVFGAPQGMTVESATPMGAVVPFTVAATDDVDGVVGVECTPGSNTLFPVGETPVSCTATDSAHNVASAQFQLIVTENPDWITPACYGNVSDIDVAYAGPADTLDNADVYYTSTDGTCSGPSVKYTVVRADDQAAADALCQGLTATNARFTPASYGYPFPADAWACRLPSSGPDTTPPVIILPSPFLVEATGPDGATATFGVDSYDLDGPSTTECTPPSGSVFPVGDTTVNCTATDASANTQTGSFTVTVTTAALWTPAGCYASTTGNYDIRYNGYQDTNGNARAYFNSDDGTCTGAGSVAFTVVRAATTQAAETVCQASGNPGGNFNLRSSGFGGFPTDAFMCFQPAGGGPPTTTTTSPATTTSTSTTTSTTTTTAPPVDSVPPVLSLPADLTQPATSATGAVVSYTVSASDAVDGAVTPTCTPASGTAFVVGVTAVACSATDLAGNQATGAFNVTVTPWTGAVQLATAENSTCARMGDGTVQCWGSAGTNHELSRRNDPGAQPQAVPGITDAVDIAGTENAYCVVRASGKVSCWGGVNPGTGSRTYDGQDCCGVEVPRVAKGITTAVDVDINESGGVCVTLANGRVMCWGQQDFFRVGGLDASTSAGIPEPAPVEAITTATAVASSGAGGFAGHACVLVVTGSVRCWGNNDDGRLGNGGAFSLPNTSDPSTVVGITNAVSVEVGNRHSCAVLADGGVRCWGRDDYGQVGSTGSGSLSPTPVDGIANATPHISLASVRSCVVLTDGRVKCWGYATLGNGSSASRSDTPVEVSGITNAVDVSVAFSHTCALLATGEVLCWGDNDQQQLGNPGAGAKSLVPVPVLGFPGGPPGAAPVDTRRPAIIVPDRLSVDAAGPAGAIVTYQATADDDEEGAVPVTCSLPSGSLFPLGTTTVVCNATDSAGNAARTRRFDVVVEATEPGAVQVSAGMTTTCARLSDGTAKCWGNNAVGQLGAGLTATSSSVPVPVANLSSVASLEVGRTLDDDGSVCALLLSGSVRCWGEGSDGQLGNGAFVDANQPVTVVGISDASAISVGGNRACAIVTAGAVKCWGRQSALPGPNNAADTAVPVEVPGVTGAVAISVGDHTSCAVLNDGTMRCWGGSTDGALGNGATNTSFSPVVVTGVSNARSVAVGARSVCALLSDASVRCWGMNAHGELGLGVVTKMQTVPGLSIDMPPATSVSAGIYSFCAVGTDGKVRCWGDTTRGQGGNGVFDESFFATIDLVAGTPRVNTPTPIVVDGLAAAVSVAVGEDHACAIVVESTVRCWGSVFPLGGSSQLVASAPTAIGGLTPGSVRSVGVGDSHTCSVSDSGVVSCWGSNDDGQVGDGTRRIAPRPVEVPLDLPAVDIAANSTWTCATVTDGTARCWGTLAGDETNVTLVPIEPAPVLGRLSGLRSISLGENQLCGLVSDGRVQCLGASGMGVLPPTVSGITTAVQVSVGGHHACAVLADRTVWCWGTNTYGQLGDGTQTTATVPVRVTGISDAVSVSAGTANTCAIVSSGAVKCWGESDRGAIGNTAATATSQLTPLAVTGVTGATTLSVSDDHACAAVTSGVTCWGTGSSYYAAPGLTGVTSLVLGLAHACVVLAGGDLRCWGQSAKGQLGTGTTWVTRPTKVSFPASTTTTTTTTTTSTTTTSTTTTTTTTLPPTTTTTTTIPGPDTTPPVLHLPEAIAKPATGLDGATVDFTATAVDAVDGVRPVACTPSSGSLFPQGPTTVACTASDLAGNVANGSFVVTIVQWSGAIKVATSDGATCALMGSGTVQCWGTNSDDQMGDRAGTVPMGVPGITAAVDIAGGNRFYCALLSDRSVKCWGRGDLGQLGTGSSFMGPKGTSTPKPTSVRGLRNVVAIDAFDDTACALVADGRVQCWGYRASTVSAGEATHTQDGNLLTLVPVTVNGITDAVEIAAGDGENTSCAVLATGRVKCWGSNANGALGSGGTTSTIEPVTVVGITNAVGVSVAETGACATLADGTARCWGLGSQGRLGTGGTASSNVPSVVVGVGSALSKIVSHTGSCVLLTTGGVKCWGPGRMGNGTSSNATTLSPVDVTGITDAIDISMARTHTCAVLASGGVMCWGETDGLQLGNASATDYLVPNPVLNLPGPDAASVDDTTRPELTLPDDVTVDATAPAGAIVSYQALADDDVDGAVPVTCSPSSGSVFPMGDTSVDCSATDAAGNTATGSFVVTVVAATAGVVGVAVGAPSCARISDGTVKCWGPNTSGSVGNGTTTPALTPVTVPGLTGVAAVAGASYGTNSVQCALRVVGTISCWGFNSSGQTGRGNQTSATSPADVVGISDASGVFGGGGDARSMCAIVTAGAVKCWGYNLDGQLGNGVKVNSSVPVGVTGITGAVSVTVGSTFACAVLGDGSVRCWGANASGQLGDGTTTSSLTPVTVTGITTAKAVVAGTGSACALLVDQKVRCWGSNGFGQLGIGVVGTGVTTPGPTLDLPPTAALASGSTHLCAADTDGLVRCWGGNNNGQTGIDEVAVLRPTLVAGLQSVADLGAGTTSTCAVSTSGALRCWGLNGATSALGLGPTASASTPVVVTGLTPGSVAQIDAGTDHTCFVVGTKVRCWGKNTEGQLGNRSFRLSSRPVTATMDQASTSVSAALNRTCATVIDGTVRCWGLVTTRNSTSPVAVSGPYGQITGAVSVSAGTSHQCALLATGSVQCDGSAASGQLGNGWVASTPVTSFPPPVTGITNAIQVASGANHSCAVLADHHVKCWGLNTSGQLGNYSTTSSPVPVEVPGEFGAVAVTAGDNHTCVIRSDTTMACWGANSFGQLGDGTTNQRSGPLGVTDLTGVTAISAGGSFTCAVLGGPVRCWGRNQYGQLGDGTTTNAITPSPVVGLTDAATVTAGTTHACAILTSGGVRCWGDNSGGQLGTGLATSVTRPTRVPGLS